MYGSRQVRNEANEHNGPGRELMDQLRLQFANNFNTTGLD